MSSDVTIFSIPKPFKGKNYILQRNAVLSWLHLDPKPNIYLLGNEYGVEKFCNKHEIKHIKDIAKNEYGTPLLDSAIKKINKISNDNFFIFINTDIILNENIYQAINIAKNKFNKFLIIGHRHDSNISSKINFNEKIKNAIFNEIIKNASYVQNPAYKDYFIYTRNLWSDVPKFAIGRASYDNALVCKAILNEIPVIDASNLITAIHQNHDYSHLNNGKNEAYNGIEAKNNYTLSKQWVGESVVGQGYIDSSTWYIDSHYFLKNNDESREDKFRQVQVLYYKLKKVGWEAKYESYSKKIEYAKEINKTFDPKISIIVVSWRFHPDTLKNFKILQQQRTENFELIFVNNGANDKEFNELVPFIDTYVKLNDNTGPCFARNFGAVFAKAPIVCFLEDDGIPESNFVKSHLIAHKKYVLNACYGSYFPKTKNPLNARAIHYFRGMQAFTSPIGLEGNTSIKSEIFYKAGGWDEDIFIMRDGLALSLRIARVDNDLSKIIYFPYSLIYHDYARDEQHFINKMKYREKSQRIIDLKYPESKTMLNYWSRKNKIKYKDAIIQSSFDRLFNKNKLPTVSIICKRQVCAELLRVLLKNINDQVYQDIEVIVPVPPNFNINRQYTQNKNVRFIHTNTDNSPYLLNKCIKSSTGDYLLFVYPKDVLVKNAVYNFVKYSLLFSKVDIFYSDSIIKQKANFSKEKPLPEFFDITHSLLDGYPQPEPLFFINKNVFAKLGYYNDTYGCQFEYDLLTKMILNSDILFKRIETQSLKKQDMARRICSNAFTKSAINNKKQIFNNLVNNISLLSLLPDFDIVYDNVDINSEINLEEALKQRFTSQKAKAKEYVRTKALRFKSLDVNSEMHKSLSSYSNDFNAYHSGLININKNSTRSLNIAMLTNSFWPVQCGMELVFHNLAIQFCKNDHNVFLFAPNYNTKFDEISSIYHVIRYKSYESILNIFENISKTTNFDILLVQSAYRVTSHALKLKEKFNLPVVLRLHGEDIQTDISTGYGWRLDPKKNSTITHNIMNVDKCIAISKLVQRELYDISPNIDVQVINNGVDVDLFYPQKNSFIDKKIGLPPNYKKVLMVGRNVSKKQFHLGLEAFAQALKKNPRMVLIHVGKEGNGVDLTGTAHKLGISDNFFQLGPVGYREINNIYNSCDILLFPSKMETFGNVTLEAMACGLPCIEFDYGANHEKIINGANGYIVPYGNIKLMAMHILELATNENKYNEFSRNAREHVAKNFSLGKIAEKYIKVFKNVINNKSYRRTTASITDALKQNPLDINLATDYLELLIKSGEYETAIKILKDYLAVLPREKRLYAIYSQLLAFQGVKIQESSYCHKALGYFEAARVLNPDNRCLLKKLGEIYLKLDHPHKALKYFKKSKELTPDTLINEKLIQAANTLQNKHNDNHKKNLSICLASDLFGTKNGDANGPAFSRIDTLASLTSISNNVSVLTSLTPGLPDAIIEYVSKTKKVCKNGTSFPSWYIANDNPAKKRLCLDEHMDTLLPDIVITDGVRLGPHKMLKNTGHKLTCPKIFIHRASPAQYSEAYSNNYSMKDILQALSEYEFHVSVSSRVMNDWRSNPELADKQWFHIPNCAREEEAEELLLKDKRQVREKLRLPEDAFLVTCLASIQKRKGQDILISLMPELAHRIPNIQILLVGPCFPHWGGKEIIEQAKNNSNSKRIYILGPRYDALEIVYASDCLVLPSREEALPRSILESMTLKIPVLASDVNGIPELIDDGIHGLLFSHDKPRQLAKKIERIAKDKAFGAEMSQHAYNKYWQNFSRAKHMERWKEVLDIIQRNSTK